MGLVIQLFCLLLIHIPRLKSGDMDLCIGIDAAPDHLTMVRPNP